MTGAVRRDAATLERARALAPLVDGQRIRVARELLGLTQRGLAEAMAGSVTAAAVSQFEKEDAKPSAVTLVGLAVATGMPVEFFAHDPVIGDVGQAGGFFRSLRSTTVRDRRRHRALAEMVRLVTVALERHVRLPDLDVPRLAVAPDADRETVEEAAAAVRAAWALGDGPVNHAVRSVERHGVVVSRVTIDAKDVDAFSVPFADRPVVVLGADKDRADRSRWDCCHELGHLVMHLPDPRRSQYLEDQANWFAAEFLLPATSVRDLLPSSADWKQLADLKVTWGVSMTALLQRAKTLGVLHESAYVQALKTMSTRGWNRREPVRLAAIESPALLGRAMEAAERVGVTVESLSAETGVPRPLLELIIGAGVDPKPSVAI